jgi:hypothetical protein
MKALIFDNHRLNISESYIDASTRQKQSQTIKRPQLHANEALYQVVRKYSVKRGRLYAISKIKAF